MVAHDAVRWHGLLGIHGVKQVFILVHQEARRRAVAAVQCAPDGYAVTITEKIKTRPQEERYHAMIGDVARQFVLYGRLWHRDHMKRILIDQFRRDTETDLADLWAKVGPLQNVPSLDGSGVVMLGAQSRDFPVRLASAFIEWLFAFGAENDIRWSDPEVIRQWESMRGRVAA